MAEKIIQNPSITTNVFEYDGAGRVSAISGHPLAGQGGGEVVKSDLMWKPNVESDGYVYWTLTSSAATPEAAYISGAQGPQGPSGTNGKDGADGISPTFTITPTAGGTHVTISGAQGEVSFDVLSGANGADGQNGQNGDPGADGYSPTVALTPITAGDQTGTEVTFTYGAGGEQTSAYTAWNGKDGTGATDYFASTTISGDGTQALPYGVDTTAAINFTNASAKFADQYWDSLEEDYAAISDDFAWLFNSMSAMEEKFADYYIKTQTSAASSLSAEFAKYVAKPDSSLVNKYLVLRTDSNGAVSGWSNFNDQSYSKSEAQGTFIHRDMLDNGPGGTLSGTGIASGSKLGANTEVIPTKDWLDDNYLPLSGGTVSGSTYFASTNGKNMIAVASAATLIGASRQTSAHFGQDTNALGTTWIGVGSVGMYRGFLKYAQGGNVGDLDTNDTMQVDFTPNNKGTIFAKAKNSGTDCQETQILNPIKASCDAMVQSANANFVSGPNYMLAKNADGQFVIGAACINCTAISDVTLSANTYYFVYEV
jgi:hypothetical protein